MSDAEKTDSASLTDDGAGTVSTRGRSAVDSVAAELAECINYARIVQRVLPIDEAAERACDAAFARIDAKRTSRKITKKARL